jgi:outer membrane lipoprotein-sorting protein
VSTPAVRCLIAAGLIAAGAQAETLPDILARMDRSAKEFKSMKAKMKQLEYTAVIDESSEKSGEVMLKRGKGASIGLVHFQQPDQQFIHFDGRRFRIFYPKANTVDVFDVGKYTGKIEVDQVLLLGFGTSGAELSKSYTIKSLGTETLGGVNTTHIELTPKLPELQKYVTKFELWIPEGQSNPIQEKALQPSKNYSTFVYSDIMINPSLPDSAFELKLPPGVKTVYPQK